MKRYFYRSSTKALRAGSSRGHSFCCIRRFWAASADLYTRDLMDLQPVLSDAFCTQMHQKCVCVCVFCSNIWLPYKVIIWVLHIKNMVMLHLTMWYVTLIAIMTKLQIINKPPYVFCFIKQNISCQSFIDKPKNIHSCRHIGSPALKRELWASNTMVIYKKQQCFII